MDTKGQYIIIITCQLSCAIKLAPIFIIIYTHIINDINHFNNESSPNPKYDSYAKKKEFKFKTKNGKQ